MKYTLQNSEKNQKDEKNVQNCCQSRFWRVLMMLARPRFKGRGVFRIGADFDSDEDELGDIIERKFGGANVGEGDPVQANNARLEGIVSDLGRMAKDAKAILAGVEDGSHLEEGDSMHGGRKVNFKKVDGIGDLLFSEGGMGASEVAGSITLFGPVELGKDKGASLRNGEGHLGGQKIEFW